MNKTIEGPQGLYRGNEFVDVGVSFVFFVMYWVSVVYYWLKVANYGLGMTSQSYFCHFWNFPNVEKTEAWILYLLQKFFKGEQHSQTIFGKCVLCKSDDFKS